MKIPTFTCCQFCGAVPAKGEKLSKTHVWPKWLNKILEIYPSCHVESTYGINSEKPYVIEKKRHQDIFTIQPRMTCVSCNGGWMNDIEQGVLDFLNPIMQNVWPPFLTAKQVNSLSIWLALICINCELESELANATTQEQRNYIMNEGKVPNDWSIIIAKNNGVHWRKRKGYHQYISESSSINGGLAGTVDNHIYDKQITTLGIGPLFAQIVSGDDPLFAAYHTALAQRDGFGILFPTFKPSPLDTARLPILNDEEINRFNDVDPWFRYLLTDANLYPSVTP